MNNSELQYQVFSYFHGVNGERNTLKAIEICKEIAADGDIYRLYELGTMYLSIVDVKNSIEYYKKGAEHGDNWAMVKLGSLYYAGYYVAKNFELAKYWYKLAADNGNTKALFCLEGFLKT